MIGKGSRGDVAAHTRDSVLGRQELITKGNYSVRRQDGVKQLRASSDDGGRNVPGSISRTHNGHL